jgi:hypothetical protein
VILKSRFAISRMEAGCEAASIASHAENDDGGCRSSRDQSWPVRLDGNECNGWLGKTKGLCYAENKGEAIL